MEPIACRLIRISSPSCASARERTYSVYLWLRCGLPLGLILALMFMVVISTVQLIAMEWNTYADAQRKAASPVVANRHRESALRERAKPNNHNG